MPTRRTLPVLRRDQSTLAALAAAQVITSPKNPYFRRARGKPLTEQRKAYLATKATSRALGDLWAAALKRARVTKRDARKLLVIDAATGRRYPSLLGVPKTRKVYLVKVDRLGRKRVYNPVDNRTLARGVVKQKKPLRLAEFDWRPLAKAEPKKFREFMTEMAAGAAKLPTRFAFEDTPFLAKTERSDVDRVAVRVANLYQKAVTAQADHTQWQVEFLLLLKGERHAIPLRLDPLRSYMFFKLTGTGRSRRLSPANRRSLGLMRAVVAFKLRDVIRRALAERGLVSAGSARRVRALAANRGKARKRWKNAAGAPWAGAGRKEVVIEALEFRLRRVL